MKYYHFVCLFVIALTMWNCGDDSGSVNTPPAQETPTAPAQVDEMAVATQAIQGKLIAYYTDLSAEQLDETKYYAPVVEQFFGSQQLDREAVGKSVRGGFANIADRTINIDAKSMAIRKEGAVYIAEFSGQQKYTKAADNSSVNERFSNQVTFNEQFEIIRYESLGAQAKNSSTQKSAQNTVDATVAGFTKAMGAGNIAAAQAFVHPDMGFYYINRPGAMDYMVHCMRINDMLTDPQGAYMKEKFLNMRCSPKRESLPEFDCDKFSKQGCFLAEPAETYQRLSFLMTTLNEYELAEFSPSDIEKARELENTVKMQLVDTTMPAAFYFGEIEGAWYIIAVDVAAYDCSA